MDRLKGSGLSGDEKRQVRAHERRLHSQARRQEEFLKRRCLPTKTEPASKPDKPQTKTRQPRDKAAVLCDIQARANILRAGGSAKTNAKENPIDRRLKLEKWRAERENKRQQQTGQSNTNKPMFKVTRVETEKSDTWYRKGERGKKPEPAPVTKSAPAPKPAPRPAPIPSQPVKKAPTIRRSARLASRDPPPRDAKPTHDKKTSQPKPAKPKPPTKTAAPSRTSAPSRSNAPVKGNAPVKSNAPVKNMPPVNVKPVHKAVAALKRSEVQEPVKKVEEPVEVEVEDVAEAPIESVAMESVEEDPEEEMAAATQDAMAETGEDKVEDVCVMEVEDDKENTKKPVTPFHKTPIPLLAKRSGSHRRSTARVLAVLKSPEERIQYLANSPMIEMSRKTPKAKKTPDAPTQSLISTFDRLTDEEIENEIQAVRLDESVSDCPSNQSFVSAAESLSTDKEHSGDSDKPESMETSADETNSSDDGTRRKRRKSRKKSVSQRLEAETSSQSETEKMENPVRRSSRKSVVSSSQSSIGEAMEVATVAPVAAEAGSNERCTYFRDLTERERNRLTGLCDDWEEVLKAEQNLDEDVIGSVRTVIGQVHLLLRKKFKQFLGLVDQCEFETGEKPILTTDLQGFWEMMNFQIEDLDAKFNDLTKRRQNDWKEDQPVVVKKKKITKKATAVKKTGGPSKFAAFLAQKKAEQAASNADSQASFVKTDDTSQNDVFQSSSDSDVTSSSIMNQECKPTLSSNPEFKLDCPDGGFTFAPNQRLLQNVMANSPAPNRRRSQRTKTSSSDEMYDFTQYLQPTRAQASESNSSVQDPIMSITLTPTGARRVSLPFTPPCASTATPAGPASHIFSPIHDLMCFTPEQGLPAALTPARRSSRRTSRISRL